MSGRIVRLHGHDQIDDRKHCAELDWSNAQDDRGSIELADRDIHWKVVWTKAAYIRPEAIF